MASSGPKEQQPCNRGAANPTLSYRRKAINERALENATWDMGSGAGTDSDHRPERSRAGAWWDSLNGIALNSDQTIAPISPIRIV